MISMKRLGISLFVAMLYVTCMAALPEVTLRDINGNDVSVSSLTQSGKPCIISFFATWCKPCMRELKAIHELYPEWQEETGVQIYLVSIDQAQDSRKVKPLVDGNGWDYSVLLDPNGTLKRAMNVQEIPHLFVFDSKGKMVYSHVGYTEGDEEEVGRKLKGEK